MNRGPSSRVNGAEAADESGAGFLKILETGSTGAERTSECDTVDDVLITIIIAVGVAVAAAGVAAGQRETEPAMIPIPVKRPRRRPD